MADIVLVNPHGINFIGDYYLPLGLLQSSVYINEKYDIKILDLRVKPNWKKALLNELKKTPYFVGISTYIGPNLISALEISRFIKENSDAKVVWGGVFVTQLPRMTLQNPFIDIIVKGEGEETFMELADAMIKNKSLKDIKGIWYKENGQIKSNPDRPLLDLNKFPNIPYDILDDIDKYIYKNDKGVRSINYMSSRGCNQLCTFCYIPNIWKSSWRQLSASKVLEDFDYLKNKFKVGHININDENFFVNLTRVEDIAKGIIERDDITWDVLGAHNATITRMTKEFIQLLDKSRCKGLQSSHESGSQRILDLIKKNINVQDVIDNNKKFIGTDIVPTYSYMSGIPTETKEELRMTIKIIFRLMKDNPNIVPGSITPFVPFPSTELYDLAIKHGFEPPTTIEGWSEMTWGNYMSFKTPWLSDKDKEMTQNLYYASMLINPNYTYIKSKFFKFMSTLMMPLEKFRVKNLNFAFPLELKVLREAYTKFA